MAVYTTNWMKNLKDVSDTTPPTLCLVSDFNLSSSVRARATYQGQK